MDGTRRGFLKAALTAAGATTTPLYAQDQGRGSGQVVPSDPALRVKSLESLLVEKGLVDPKASTRSSIPTNTRSDPVTGARVVARAWVDSAYKQRLLANADAALAELGYGGLQGEHMVAVGEHSLRAQPCGLYPLLLLSVAVLGLPPVWYKSAPYRSRSVIDPRGVLRELGLDLPASVAVQVWDSTAELRYMVIPERPAGTETLGEEQLADLVTRDSMIGVAKVSAPQVRGRL
jgi:nitrile hydratase